MKYDIIEIARFDACVGEEISVDQVYVPAIRFNVYRHIELPDGDVDTRLMRRADTLHEVRAFLEADVPGYPELPKMAVPALRRVSR